MHFRYIDWLKIGQIGILTEVWYGFAVLKTKKPLRQTAVFVFVLALGGQFFIRFVRMLRRQVTKRTYNAYGIGIAHCSTSFLRRNRKYAKKYIRKCVFTYNRKLEQK